MWSGFVSGLCEGELYKYRIHGADGSVVMRADPYAFASEIRPANASRLTKLDFSFDDSAWMERRDKCRDLPMNIYELHAGSWKHKPNSTPVSYTHLSLTIIPRSISRFSTRTTEGLVTPSFSAMLRELMSRWVCETS